MCVTVATLAQEGPSGWMLLPLSSLASAMSVSKRRSSSAPARGSWIDRVRRRDTHTVGISGMESPTGLRAVTNLWYEIQKKAVPCRPSIRTSSILSGLVEASTLVYIMLFWNPVREVRGITRGNLWHTTLVRATIPATRQATVAFDTLIDRLQTTLQALMQPDIPFTLELAPQSSNEKLTEGQIAGGKDKKEKPYADKGWTPERRAEHAAAIEARQRQIAGELQALQTATDEGGTSSNEKLTKEQIAGGKHNNAGKGWTPARRAEYAAAIEVRQRQIAGEHQALQTATGEVAKSSMKKVTKEIAGELQALQTAAEEALQTTTEQAARPPNETLTKEPTAGGPHAALPSSKRPWFV